MTHHCEVAVPLFAGKHRGGDGRVLPQMQLFASATTCDTHGPSLASWAWQGCNGVGRACALKGQHKQADTVPHMAHVTIFMVRHLRAHVVIAPAPCLVAAHTFTAAENRTHRCCSLLRACSVPDKSTHTLPQLITAHTVATAHTLLLPLLRA